MKWFRRKKKQRNIILRPQGNLFNLEAIYHEINEMYFDSQVEARITWFGRGVRTPKSSITFGAYYHHLKLIKINRLLDSGNYPEFFVRYIVFHEMLHNFLPPKQKKRGRRDVHHYEFKLKENSYEDFKKAKAFLKEWRTKHFDTCR